MFKRYVFIQGLTNLIESDGKYLINNKGQIKDIEGNDLPISRDQEGHQLVHCRSWDGVRDYRVIDLVAIQFKSLQIPLKEYGKVIAFVVDGNQDHTHAKNIGYRFEGGKLEVEGRPGFFYIPSATRVAINLEGKIVDLKTGKDKKWFVSKPVVKGNIKGGYYTGFVWFCANVQTSFGRHRALCLVFKDYPDNVDSMTVNHKDGVPGNDDLDNLEWATRGENNTHAYVNDLKSQHDRVLSRDVLTGEIVEYYSISECARVLGYRGASSISFRLQKCKFSQVFQDGKQFKLKSDQRNWMIPEDPVVAIRDAKATKPIFVRNCATMQIKEYESISACGKDLEIENSSIKLRLETDNETPLFGYQFKLIDDQRPWLYFTQEQYLASLTPNSFKVSARNLLTGETKEFASIRKAEEFFDNTFIAQKLRGGFQPLLESGWQIKYANWEWEEVKDFEEAIYKLRRDTMARNEETGACILAAHAAQLSIVLKLDAKAIRQAALTRGNKVYKGYRFRLGKDTEPWPTTVAANKP